MTWYYADWSWVYTWTTTAAVVMGCVAVICAIANLIRSHLSARPVQVLVPIERDLRHAPHRHNGSRAA